MRKIVAIVCVLAMVESCAVPVGLFAAVQAITTDTNINANGSADGCRFNADAVLTVTAGSAVNNNNNANGITNNTGTNYQGTVTFAGNSATKGNLGAATGTSLKQINIGTGTVTTTGNLRSQEVDFTGDGALSVADTKNITTANGVLAATGNTGTLTFNGTSSVTGDAGSATNLLKKINADGVGKTLTFNDDAFVTALNFGGAGTVVMADGSNLTATTTTSANNTGILTCNGTTAVTGTVGAAGTVLNQINANGSSTKTATFDGDVFASALNFGGNGTVVMTDGSDLTALTTTTTNNTGKLTFNGASAVTGDVGAGAAILNRVNVNGAGKTVTFNNDIFATTVNFGGDGTVAMADGGDITAATTTSANGTGALTFAGDSTVTGNVGTTANLLRQVNADGGAGKTVAFGGSLRAGILNFGGDGTVTIADTKDMTARVTTSTNNTGTLTFLGSTDVVGNVGSSGALLKTINAGAAGETVTFDGDVYASGLVLSNTGTVKIFSGKNLNAPVTAATDGTGTVTFNGATTTGGNIGAVGNALAAVNFYGATGLGHDIAATLTTIRSGSTVKLSKNVTVTGNLTVNNVADCVLDIGQHTLNLAGTGIYRQSANSKLMVGVSGTASGSVVGSGNAVVNATSAVDVAVNGYVANNAAFKIIDSAGGGTVNVPGAITSSSPLYTFAGTAAAGDLTITATQIQTLGSVTTGNGAAAGAVLQSVANAGATGDMLTVINTLYSMTSTEAMANALQTLVPVVDGAVTTTSASTLNQYITTTMDHLEHAIVKPAPTGIATGGDYLKGVDVWAQGFGDYAQQNARGASNGYNATVWGIAGGFDQTVYHDTTRAGLGSGYAQSFVRSKDNSGRTDIDSYQGTVYGGYQDPDLPYYVDCAFTFAYNDYDSSRHIGVGAIDRVASADYGGQQYSVYGGFGYTFTVKKLLVTPLVTAQYMHLHVDGYTEEGAGALSLTVASQDYDMFQTGFGAKVEYPIKLKYLTIIPEAHAKLLYDFIGDTQATTSTFSGGGGSFATNGFTPAQTTGDFGCKLSLITKKDVALEVNYDLQVKEDYWEHTGWVNVSIKL